MKKTKSKTIDMSKPVSLYDMFDYLCSKVDWGKSFLDADGVVCMNELFKRLSKDKINLGGE